MVFQNYFLKCKMYLNTLEIKCVSSGCTLEKKDDCAWFQNIVPLQENIYSAALSCIKEN